MFYEPEPHEMFSPERPFEGTGMWYENVNLDKWIAHFPAYIPNFREAVKEWFRECVQWRFDNPEDKTGCHYFELPAPDGYRCAIVLGYDSEDVLCAKIAYQTEQNIMQCDYDVDWLHPTQNNEIFDIELSVRRFDMTGRYVDFLLDWYLELEEENFN